MRPQGHGSSELELIHSIVELLRPLDGRQRAYVLRAASGRLGEGGGGPHGRFAVDDALGKLSKREREVFDFLVDAHSNGEIAAALCISAKTVESHRGRIFKKLEVHSLVELVRLAFEVERGRKSTVQPVTCGTRLPSQR